MPFVTSRIAWFERSMWVRTIFADFDMFMISRRPIRLIYCRYCLTVALESIAPFSNSVTYRVKMQVRRSPSKSKYSENSTFEWTPAAFSIFVFCLSSTKSVPHRKLAWKFSSKSVKMTSLCTNNWFIDFSLLRVWHLYTILYVFAAIIFENDSSVFGTYRPGSKYDRKYE